MVAFSLPLRGASGGHLFFFVFFEKQDELMELVSAVFVAAVHRVLASCAGVAASSGSSALDLMRRFDPWLRRELALLGDNMR